MSETPVRRTPTGYHLMVFEHLSCPACKQTVRTAAYCRMIQGGYELLTLKESAPTVAGVCQHCGEFIYMDDTGSLYLVPEESFLELEASSIQHLNILQRIATCACPTCTKRRQRPNRPDVLLVGVQLLKAREA